MRRSMSARAAVGACVAAGFVAGAFAVLHGVRSGASAVAQTPPPLTEAWSLVDTWTGTGVSAPGSVLAPAGMDIDDGGTVWLVDAGNHRLQAFDAGGAFLRSVGARGAGDGELDSPQDVVVEAGTVYATDGGNRRLARFELDGGPLEAWSHPDLAQPWGVAADGGRVYVSDPETGEIFVFEEGSVVARWSGLSRPMGLDIGPAGEVWVAENGASSATRLSPDGVVTRRISVRFPPTDIGVDEYGDLYVQTGDSILWYEDGADRTTLALYYLAMRGIAVSSRVGVLATVASDSRLFHGVVVFEWRPRDGASKREWPLLEFPPGLLSKPGAIHAGPDMRIWIADGWPRVQAFSRAGVPELQRPLPGRAVDLTVAPSGQVVAVERSRIHRLLPDGVISGSLALRRGGRDYWITGLALDPDGEAVRLLDAAPSDGFPSGRAVFARRFGITSTLQPVGEEPLIDLEAEPWELLWDIGAWAADDGAERVFAVNRTRRSIDVYAAGSRIGRWPTDGIPTRLAVGPDGDVFVLNTDGIVWRHDPAGTIIAGWDASAFSAGASSVVDLTVDAEGRVYTLDQAAGTVRVWAVDPGGVPERPISRAGACRLRGDKRAAPPSLRLGESVTVTLEVGGECPDTAPRADIVLAIDRSGSMNDNGGITATREAAIAFLDGLDLTEDRIAVVAFNTTAQLLSPLGDDAAAAREAIASMNAIGGTNLAAALDLSAGELFGPRGRTDAKPVIVFLTDGRPADGPEATLAAAARAKARGARIFMIGFGDIDPMIMALSASTPEDAYFAVDPSTLAAIYAEIASRISADVLARRMEIVDVLPDEIRFERAIEGPTPVVSGRTLRWTLSDVGFEGTRLAYLVEPEELGRQPTNVEAYADFDDGLEREGRLRFPVPEVEVLALRPSATPTLTPFPTASPTPPPPRPIYLPIAVKQSCVDETIATDIVIVMDNSGSMNEPAGARAEAGEGRTKLDAAIAAARTLVDRMREGDRAAVVVFHETAVLVQPLTSDVALLGERLEAIETESGTRIDRGLQAAIDELEGERKVEGNTRVIALLTDGRSSVDDEAVLEVAAEARGVTDRVFAIGLGSEAELDVELLRRIASAERDFFIAPSADELAAIYAQIALTLECANLRWP